MANSLFKSQFLYSNINMPVMLYMNAAIGASGAPTLSASGSIGIASIVRNSAGNYTITYGSAYARFIYAGRQFVMASGFPAAPNMVIKSNTSSTLVVEFQNSAGTATDPDSGSTLLMEIRLANSDVVY